MIQDPKPPPSIRNVAIIAHVDHGKTTLVDTMFRCAATFRVNQRVDERAMDTDPLERERGITILAKNTSIDWKGVKINIVDTPGHADFGGQVERTLSMADGALLVVDAAEGPMPQTRFVLRKAFEHELRPIVVVNKLDRQDARADAVVDEVFDLFCSLDADDEALEFPIVYASSKEGWASLDATRRGGDVAPLLDLILEKVPPPEADPEGAALFQCSTIDYDSYVGRIAIGRVRRGTLRAGQRILVLRQVDGARHGGVVKNLSQFHGLDRLAVPETRAGDIAAVSGVEDVGIGDTFCDPEHPEVLPAITVDEPTISMIFSVNDSPFCGRSGKFVTSRQVRVRLERAVLADVALRIEDTESPDAIRVSGRGLMHLGILIENMRREGYEFQVGPPAVIYRTIDGKLHEPVEDVIVEAPSATSGKVIELLGRRRGTMKHMDRRGDFTRLEFSAPSRGLFGLRTLVLNLTQGEGTVHHVFEGYERLRGSIETRMNGSLVAHEPGSVTTYALEQLADRGDFFVKPGDLVYRGQVVGEHCKDADIDVNVAKMKKLTNMRSSTSERTRMLTLAPPRAMMLEEALEWIREDELLEVTPAALRIRKIQLDAKQRKRARAGGRTG